METENINEQGEKKPSSVMVAVAVSASVVVAWLIAVVVAALVVGAALLIASLVAALFPVPDPNEEIRLNKYMSNAGLCSRREADEFIQQGLVKVNGQVVTELGTKITAKDVVEYDEKVVTLESKCYILLNKPKDCVTTSDDPNGRLTVMDLVKGACNERIYPVGRLDRNTTGVLLLTNDGVAEAFEDSAYDAVAAGVYLYAGLVAVGFGSVADGVGVDGSVFKLDAVGYALHVVFGDVLVAPYVVDFLLHVFRVGEFRGEVAVVGEQQHSCGVAVSHRRK